MSASKHSTTSSSGGAWKVAYADFVTAMMALFLVMWIYAQKQDVRLAAAAYFKHPFPARFSALPQDAGVMPATKSVHDGPASDGKDTKRPSATEGNALRPDLMYLLSVADRIKQVLCVRDDTEDKPIEIQVTSDGIRVTLFNRARQPMFVGGGTTLTPWGKFVLENLAWLIDRYRVLVSIEGHARSGLRFSRKDYAAWELSSDRANAARRALVYYAVAPDLIERVSGFGDSQLVAGQVPTSESNQRVVLMLAPKRQGDADGVEAN